MVSFLRLGGLAAAAFPAEPAVPGQVHQHDPSYGCSSKTVFGYPGGVHCGLADNTQLCSHLFFWRFADTLLLTPVTFIQFDSTK